MRYINATCFSNGAGASANGSAIDTNTLEAGTFQVVSGAGNLGGTVKIQMSNDGSTWTDISSATATMSAGAGNAVIGPLTLAYAAVRAVWTTTTTTTSTTTSTTTTSSTTAAPVVGATQVFFHGRGV